MMTARLRTRLDVAIHRIGSAVLAAAAVGAISCTEPNRSGGVWDATGNTPIYDVRIVQSYPHDTDAFTQGLFIADGVLFESTGLVGRSALFKRELETGAVLAKRDLPSSVFGEGATLLGDHIYSLTWRAGVGFVHARDDFSQIRRFRYDGEGWGLTTDGARLIMSDGTSELRVFDPATFNQIGAIRVALNDAPATGLNELEWVEGEIWANVFEQDVVFRIDPHSGAVTGVIDIAPLFPATQRANPQTDVANGIAFGAATGRLFLTGKNWPFLFEVALVER